MMKYADTNSFPSFASPSVTIRANFYWDNGGDSDNDGLSDFDEENVHLTDRDL